MCHTFGYNIVLFSTPSSIVLLQLDQEMSYCLSRVLVSGNHLLFRTDRNLPHPPPLNRPFARSGHMLRNKLCCDANNAVGLPKEMKVGLDWKEFLCFVRLTALFAS